MKSILYPVLRGYNPLKSLIVIYHFAFSSIVHSRIPLFSHYGLIVLRQDAHTVLYFTSNKVILECNMRIHLIPTLR